MWTSNPWVSLSDATGGRGGTVMGSTTNGSLTIIAWHSTVPAWIMPAPVPPLSWWGSLLAYLRVLYA